VFRINGRFLDVAGALASDLGITPTHWQIIAIVREKPHTIPAISRRVGLRRQSVQHNITQLLARGLVEQAVNPDHRRASLVRLSADGQRLMAELAGRQAVLAGRFTPEGGLGAAKLAAATTLLRRMREASEAGLGED